MLHENVKTAWPVDQWRDVHVLVAVSGGADSVAMLRTLHELKRQAGGQGQLVVGHFNHQLRGAEADADAAWVARLCDQLQLACEVGTPPPQAPVAHSEQAARDRRHAFLQQTAQRLGARYVATAHTANDQTETVLMRLLRGTGLAGLAGIPFTRPMGDAVSLVRPLLSSSRAQVLAELQRLDQPYREDATNRDQHFTRNRVRHSLLPLLREQFGEEVDASLCRLAEQAAQSQAVVDAEARRLYALAITFIDPGAANTARATSGSPGHGEKEVVQPNRHRAPIHNSPQRLIQIDCRRSRTVAQLLVAEAIKLAWREVGWPEQAMGRQQWCQLAELVTAAAPTPAFDLPGGVHARRDGDLVQLRRP